MRRGGRAALGGWGLGGLCCVCLLCVSCVCVSCAWSKRGVRRVAWLRVAGRSRAWPRVARRRATMSCVVFVVTYHTLFVAGAMLSFPRRTDGWTGGVWCDARVCERVRSIIGVRTNPDMVLDLEKYWRHSLQPAFSGSIR